MTVDFIVNSPWYTDLGLWPTDIVSIDIEDAPEDDDITAISDGGVIRFVAGDPGREHRVIGPIRYVKRRFAGQDVTIELPELVPWKPTPRA